jgi:hypothetical protein
MWNRSPVARGGTNAIADANRGGAMGQFNSGRKRAEQTADGTQCLAHNYSQVRNRSPEKNGFFLLNPLSLE